MISSDEVFFAATGITTGALLSGVRYRGDTAETESLVLRSETGTRRFVRAEHLIT
jgi:fructose-1,6-bisphosphatase II